MARILYQPHRLFSYNDSKHVDTTGKGMFDVVIDMLKRYRLAIAVLGKTDGKGVDSPQHLADICNKKLKGEFYNQNHMRHVLNQLRKIGVVRADRWALTPHGETIFNNAKKIPRN